MAEHCRTALSDSKLHSPAVFVELVAHDDLIDVFARPRKIDVSQKVARRNGRAAISSGPTLSATGAGIVLGQSEGKRIGLMFPVVKGPPQIP